MQEAHGSWIFDVRELDKMTEGHSLSCLAFWLFQVGNAVLLPNGQHAWTGLSSTTALLL